MFAQLSQGQPGDKHVIGAVALSLHGLVNDIVTGEPVNAGGHTLRHAVSAQQLWFFRPDPG